MRRAVLACALLAFAAAPRAEIEKHAQSCEKGVCLWWWPKLPPLNGWHHEDGPSYQYGANALAPDGSSFAAADSVIYAEALYKPRIPKTRSVQALIEDDRRRFTRDTPGVVIAEAPPLATADGRKLRSLTFFPAGAGNWERVSFGEEGDYYLIFTLSSRSKQAYQAALPAYASLIAGYRERP